MIELSKHIESLLLENDCVIVPELGGFIAHYQSAYYEESEGLFIPPVRTVGFNPQLTMNDGLLAQSYMQAYHTDYSDAMTRISGKVDLMKTNLYEGETVEFYGIGSLRYNIYDEYEFQSNESGLFTPALYGLDAFSMSPLSEVLPKEILMDNQSEIKTIVSNKEIRLEPLRWIGNAVAVAVAVILFFVLSVPVENTYIDKGSYASLGTDCLFDAIRSQSMVTALPLTMGNYSNSSSGDLKPKVVKVEKVAPTKNEESVVKKENDKVAIESKSEPKVVAKSSKAEVKKTVHSASKNTASVEKKVVAKKNKYHIIVASLATSTDAQRMLKEYSKKGYDSASVLEGNGRFRIALCSFSDKAAAYNKLNVLKKEETFKSAWMLSSK